MGVRSQTVTGARLVLYINGQKAGVFANIDYGQGFGVTPVFILGKYEPGEIVYTDQSEVMISVSGFRVFNNGPHAIGSVPKLQDLLNHEDIYLTLVDRQNPNGPPLATFTGVRPAGYTSSAGAKGLQNLNINFMGIITSDESGPQGDASSTTYG